MDSRARLPKGKECEDHERNATSESPNTASARQQRRLRKTKIREEQLGERRRSTLNPDKQRAKARSMQRGDDRRLKAGNMERDPFGIGWAHCDGTVWQFEREYRVSGWE